MRRYYIDLITWEIHAETQEQAEDKALVLMKAGNIPTISSVDDTEDDEPLKDDLIDSIKAEEIL